MNGNARLFSEELSEKVGDGTDQLYDYIGFAD